MTYYDGMIESHILALIASSVEQSITIRPSSETYGPDMPVVQGKKALGATYATSKMDIALDITQGMYIHYTTSCSWMEYRTDWETE